MPSRLLSLLVLCCCLLAAPARALDPGKAFGHYVRDAWSVPEGLPQISAMAIAQTPDGYLWVGTQAGLARFDGVGFTTFTPTSHPALPHPYVQALAVDDGGALWIGTVAGLAVLRGDGFHAVPWTGNGPAPMVTRLHPGADGRIWAATLEGVAYVDDGRLHPLPGPEWASSVLVTAAGAVWVSGEGGVTRWDGRSWETTGWPARIDAWQADLVELDGEVWAATMDGFYVYRSSAWHPVPGASGADALPLNFAYRDGDGNLWGGGDRGLVRIRPEATVERIPATSSNGLLNLYQALEDREGNLWLGSMSDGLIRVRNGWTRRYSAESGLPDTTVWTLAPDPGGDGLWAGTGGGVAHLGRDGRFSAIATGAADAELVLDVFAEPGGVWIMLAYAGLVHHEPGNATPAAAPVWAAGTPLHGAGVSRDDDGNLWIASTKAMLRWDGSTLERFDETRGLSGMVARLGPMTLRNGRVLAMTRTALLEFDGHAFQPAPEGVDLPADVILHTLVELSNGSLLLTDSNASLLLRHADRWHRVDAAAGLFPGNIFQIIEHEGELWVTIAYGVYRLQLEELMAFADGRVDRVRPEMVVDERGLSIGSQQTVCCNSAGLNRGFVAQDALWVPTRDGVLAIDINDIRRNPHPPKIHLGRVRVGEQWRTLPGESPATFQADERDLSLAFDVLSFQDPRSNQVRYRLAGYDQEWQSVASMVREVRYTNLPPGDYAFEVMASNNSGVWTADPARLEFRILPRFHETAAFRILLALLAMLLAYAGYRYQRYRYRMRQMYLERLVDQRTDALADSNQKLEQSNVRLAEANGQLEQSNEKLAESNRQLEQASLTDPLTGLRNRRYLVQQIPADISYYGRQRRASHPDAMVFAMLDLDHFKQVNDVHGHATGDRVLAETARRLERLVRAGDYVVRWGGEEFLLVFRPMPPDHVLLLGQRLRDVIAQTPFDIGEGRSITLTASVGLSEYPLFHSAGQPLGWEAMVDLADQAAYHVKRAGRDGWAIFRPTGSTRVGTLLADLQRDPQALLASGELNLVGSVAGRPAGRS